MSALAEDFDEFEEVYESRSDGKLIQAQEAVLERARLRKEQLGGHVGSMIRSMLAKAWSRENLAGLMQSVIPFLPFRPLGEPRHVTHVLLLVF